MSLSIVRKPLYFLALAGFTALVLVPSEWIQVYLGLQSLDGNLKSEILIPVEGVDVSCLTDTFGAPRANNRIHEGIDLFAPHGTPVVFALDGIILFRGRDILGGNVVKVLSVDKRIHYYAHLESPVQFSQGERVKRGELLGYVGNTGNAASTPPHLHLEIIEIEWLLPLVTRSINPYTLLLRAKPKIPSVFPT